MKYICNRNLRLAATMAALALPVIVQQASAQCVAGLGGGAAQLPARVAGDYTGILIGEAPDTTTIHFVQPSVIKDGIIVDSGLNKVFEVTGYIPSVGLIQGNERTLPVKGLPVDVMGAAGYNWFLMSNNDLVALNQQSLSLPGAKIPLGSTPVGMTYDGTYVWVAVANGLWQIKVPPANLEGKQAPTAVTEYPLPAPPTGELLFDGSAIWIPAGNSIFPFDPISYQAGPQFNLGGNITQMVFDGVYLWVSEGTNANVSEFDPLKGITVNNFITPNYASVVAFDGSNVWVGDSSIPALYKVRACDASRSTVLPDTGFLKLDAAAATLRYDGVRKWITYANSPIISVR